ncbi:MAG: hypothetical protein RQ743_14520 [Bacteroidales bacterium]|nr:hypothetical protein [ANME-2 cluster archaeon]MDT8402897.1 hypothetical protein [Bacteroidales bacterium]MDW7774891.1 hypothetical protein [Methanosarcinales archaeon]
MGNVKDEVIKMIHTMPNGVSIDDIMAELFFRQKVDAGLYALDIDQGLEHEKVKEKLNKWLE